VKRVSCIYTNLSDVNPIFSINVKVLNNLKKFSHFKCTCIYNIMLLLYLMLLVIDDSICIVTFSRIYRCVGSINSNPGAVSITEFGKMVQLLYQNLLILLSLAKLNHI
jgi:hypothetical protein